MFARRSLFIVGAGCSHEFGFPLGYKFRNTIHNSANTEFSRFYNSPLGIACQMATNLDNSMVEIKRALEVIRDGVHTRPSIDQFLDYHAKDALVVFLGKLFIANAILRFEHSSPLMKAPLQNGKWLERLFHGASNDVKPDNIVEMFSNVRFICFNYDRCIEHFLYNQVVALTGGNMRLAKTVCSKLKIYHPYGSVGPAPWEAESGYLFGELPEKGDKLLKAAQGLKIFTERMEPHAESNEARFGIHQADQIIFLGFSYIDQNMELLAVEGRKSTPVFANMYGMSDQNSAFAKQPLIQKIGGIPTQYGSLAETFMDNMVDTIRR